MKLRIRGNSVRLRLSRGEVQAVAEARAVEEHTHFAPGAVLTYRFALGSGAPSARFDGRVLEVTWPHDVGVAWALGTEITLEALLPLAGHEDGLRVLVEKDFACLQPRPGEDESDAFPHPDAGTGATC